MGAIMVWNVQAYRKNASVGEPLGPYASAEAAIKAANAAFTPAIDEAMVFNPEHRDQAFLRLKGATKDIGKQAQALEQRLRKAKAKVSSHVLMTKSILVEWTGLNTPLPDTFGIAFQAKVNGANVSVHISHEALQNCGEVSCKNKAREKLEQAAKTGAIPNPMTITSDDFKT